MNAYQNTKDLDEKIVAQQSALGAIMQRLEQNGVNIQQLTMHDVETYNIDKIENLKAYKKLFGLTDDQARLFNQQIQRLGQYITDMNDKVRSNVVQMINNSILNGDTINQTATALRDRFGYLNRDWERISSYESQYAYHNGYLSSIIKDIKSGETVYVQGISQPSACKYCQSHINRKIFILTSDTSKTGNMANDEYADGGYMVLGATNIGRKPNDYIATIPMHPHCYCRVVRWYPEFEE